MGHCTVCPSILFCSFLLCAMWNWVYMLYSFISRGFDSSNVLFFLVCNLIIQFPSSYWTVAAYHVTSLINFVYIAFEDEKWEVFSLMMLSNVKFIYNVDDGWIKYDHWALVESYWWENWSGWKRSQFHFSHWIFHVPVSFSRRTLLLGICK